MIDTYANSAAVDNFAAALGRRGYPLFVRGCEAGAAELAAAGEAVTFCPLHESDGAHDPSLSVTLSRDGGRVLTYCQVCRESPFAAIMRGEIPQCAAEYRPKLDGGGSGSDGGCPADRVGGRKQHRQRSRMAALEIETEADYARWCDQEAADGGGVREVATYYYGADRDRAQYAKVRFTDKGFLWLRRDGWGRWRAGLGSRTPPLYGAWTVPGAGGVVWAVEGEKDADLLHSWGLAAVSTAEPPVGDGGGGWPEREASREANRRELYAVLRGASVIVVPDADDAGAALAERFAREAERAGAASVTVLAPLGTVKGYDVSDFAADGGDRAALEALAATANHVSAAQKGCGILIKDSVSMPHPDSPAETQETAGQDVCDAPPPIMPERTLPAGYAVLPKPGEPAFRMARQRRFARETEEQAYFRRVDGLVRGACHPEDWHAGAPDSPDPSVQHAHDACKASAIPVAGGGDFVKAVYRRQRAGHLETADDPGWAKIDPDEAFRRAVSNPGYPLLAERGGAVRWVKDKRQPKDADPYPGWEGGDPQTCGLPSLSRAEQARHVADISVKAGRATARQVARTFNTEIRPGLRCRPMSVTMATKAAELAVMTELMYAAAPGEHHRKGRAWAYLPPLMKAGRNPALGRKLPGMRPFDISTDGAGRAREPGKEHAPMHDASTISTGPGSPC